MKAREEYVHDIDVVLDMLKEAEKFGMEVEVIYSFGNERQSGEDCYSAAIHALYEWDI